MDFNICCGLAAHPNAKPSRLYELTDQVHYYECICCKSKTQGTFHRRKSDQIRVSYPRGVCIYIYTYIWMDTVVTLVIITQAVSISI